MGNDGGKHLRDGDEFECHTREKGEYVDERYAEVWIGGELVIYPVDAAQCDKIAAEFTKAAEFYRANGEEESPTPPADAVEVKGE